MHESFGLHHRRFPRFNTEHRVEVAPGNGGLHLSGLLYNLSQEGCCLRLDRQVPPGTPIEVRCYINGPALRLLGKVVWLDALGWLRHGVAIRGFSSEADTLFHRWYLHRLARETSPPSGSA